MRATLLRLQQVEEAFEKAQAYIAELEAACTRPPSIDASLIPGALATLLDDRVTLKDLDDYRPRSRRRP